MSILDSDYLHGASDSSVSRPCSTEATEEELEELDHSEQSGRHCVLKHVPFDVSNDNSPARSGIRSPYVTTDSYYMH